jgi:hypothetical protein
LAEYSHSMEGTSNAERLLRPGNAFGEPFGPQVPCTEKSLSHKGT